MINPVVYQKRVATTPLYGEIKKQRLGKKTFGNLFLLQRSRFQAVWEAQRSIDMTKEQFTKVANDIKHLKQIEIVAKLFDPLNNLALRLTKANKAGNTTEKEILLRDLIKLIKIIVEQEKMLASNILTCKNSIERHNKSLLVKQRIFRICLFAIREAAVLINKSNFAHQYEAYRRDRRIKQRQAVDNDDDYGDDKQDEEKESEYNDLLPEDILNLMDIDLVTKQIIGADGSNEQTKASTIVTSNNASIESISHNRADVDFIRRINVEKMTPDDKVRGVRIFNDCRRHLKTMMEMCDAIDKRMAQILNDHEMFVASFRDYIKY